MMNTFKYYLLFSLFYISFFSCSDNPNSIEKEQTGIINFRTSGNKNITFITKTVKLNLPDSNSNYLTIFGSYNDSKLNMSIVIRLFVSQNNREFEFDNDNFATISFDNGSDSFRSTEGNLKILEWDDMIFKATFQASFENLEEKDITFNINNGNIEINI